MNLPEIGTACKYTFTAPFVSLNGVYILRKLMSYEQALVDGIDFVEHLYKLAGRTEEDYDAEWTDHRDGRVLMLENSNDPSAKVVYAFDGILAMLPDPMVRRYHELYAAIDLGILASPDDVVHMLAQLNDIAAAVTGTSAAASLFSTKQIWMSEADYQAIDSARQARIRELKPVTTSLIERDATIAQLRAIIKHYEDILVAAQTPSTP